MRDLILSLSIITLFPLSSTAQKSTDISAEKEMLHYQKFPLSGNVNWLQVDNLIQARFSYNGEEKIVIYNDLMKIVQEWTKMTFIPVEVDIHLSTQYDSPKIKAVYQVEDKLNNTSFYSALVKIKGEGVNMHAFNKIMEAMERVTMLAMME